MGLLAPLFLAGLLAVAVPVLVHLVHRERKEPLAFPSLMFLRRVPFRSAKRQRIRYWLLFLMRTAALILIAAAFSRPWIQREAAAAGGGQSGKDIVILYDRSYSMSAHGVQERAQKAARDAVAGAGDRDRVAVIGFGERAELLARLDGTRQQAQAAVQQIEPGSDVTRFAPAFKLAGSVLSETRRPAELVVISDRQRTGWRNLEQVPMPPRTTIRVVDVAAEGTRNIAITDVQLARSEFSGRQRIVPSARLVNRGASAVTVPVSLRLGGRVQQSRTIEVPAQGSATASFDAMYAGATTGDIRIDHDDDVATDNTAYFTTTAAGAPAVRVVSGNADATYFFENALRAGDANAFEIHRGNTSLGGADLQGTSVVVLLETNGISAAAATRLEEFVRQGGGLVIAGGTLRTSALVPLRTIRPVVREERPAALVDVDASHPVFEPFRATSAEQFASVRISNYLRGEAAEGVTVAARFDDGSPALLESRIGRGRVLYWASGFSRASGELVLSPVFVPFVQQLVRHAASSGHVPSSFTVGNVVDVNAFAPGDRDAVVITPSRERIRMQASERARTLRIAEPGIYQIRGTGAGGSTQTLAANVDIGESDFTTVPAQNFKDAIAPGAAGGTANMATVTPLDHEQQQGIWWYLLVSALALLAAETLLGNRISSAWRT